MSKNEPIKSHMTYRASPQDGLAWVTGASSGVGRAVALELARRGYRVVATARNQVNLDTLVQDAARLQQQIIAWPGDVTDGNAMGQMAAHISKVHGPIALAFLNAGVSPYVEAGSFSVAPFEQVLSVNVMGIVNVLNGLLPIMSEQKKGQIILNGSVAGYGGLPRAAAYGMSKAAIIHLAEALNFDMPKLGLSIQVVNHGFVDTPLTRKNDFPMPFLMSCEEAAKRICDGFKSSGFEIIFPRRMAWGLKLLNHLPYPLYFYLMRLITAWDNRN